MSVCHATCILPGAKSHFAALLGNVPRRIAEHGSGANRICAEYTRKSCFARRYASKNDEIGQICKISIDKQARVTYDTNWLARANYVFDALVSAR